jgi:hypothetical protein
VSPYYTTRELALLDDSRSALADAMWSFVIGAHDNITVVLIRVAEARVGATSTSRSN